MHCLSQIFGTKPRKFEILASDWWNDAINIFYEDSVGQSAHKSAIKTDSSAAWLSV